MESCSVAPGWSVTPSTKKERGGDAERPRDSGGGRAGLLCSRKPGRGHRAALQRGTQHSVSPTSGQGIVVPMT